MPLEQYAVPSLQLTEPLYPNNKAYGQTFTMCLAGGLLAASPIILAAGWGNGTHIAIGYAIAAFWLVPIMSIIAGSHRNYVSRKSGSVHFDGETVTITCKLKCCSAALKTCRYFYGDASWATLPGISEHIAASYGGALLIELPDNFRIPPQHLGRGQYLEEAPVIISVGHTPPTRQLWEDALWRLGTERDEEKERRPAPFSFVFVFLSYPLLFWAIVLGERYLFSYIDGLLHYGNAPQDVMQGIEMPLSFPGRIYFIFVLFDLYTIALHKRAVVKYKTNSPEYVLSFIVLFLAGVSLCHYFGDGGITRRFIISAAATALMVIGTIGYIFALKRRRNDAAK